MRMKALRIRLRSGTTPIAASFLAAMISGCVVISDGVRPGDPLNASFRLTWATLDVSTNTEIDCVSAGADTVRTTAVNLSTGDQRVALFDCRRENGAVYGLTAGETVVIVELVRCGDDTACMAPAPVSSELEVGPYFLFGDVSVDLGHFVFPVDTPRET